MNKLESGELQLRVRALELERAMVRNAVMQRASLHAIAACVGCCCSAPDGARSNGNARVQLTEDGTVGDAEDVCSTRALPEADEN